MTQLPTQLIDQSSSQVAVLNVQFRNGHFEGTIDLTPTPPELRRLFEQFEEIVEGQMFSLLDDIEEKIGTIPLRAVLTDGTQAYIGDLQVFPSTKSVSFVIRQPAVK